MPACSGTSAIVSTVTPNRNAVPAIFDPRRRRQRRDRLANAGPSAFESYVAEALLDRLDTVTRRFGSALVINTGGGALTTGLRARGIRVDATDYGQRYAVHAGALWCAEDALPVAPGTYDLVIAAAGLDTVNDLPGALVLARRALVADGLFLGAMVGAPSLPALRRAIVEVDAAQTTAVARMHPLLDVRAAGDLLVRAGFALPVADLETIALSYPGLAKLLSDLRESGMTSVLPSVRPVGRDWVRRVAERFEAGAVEGRVHETVSLLMLTGWSPADSQPRPAARGSATASLAAALRSSPPA